MIDDDVLAFLRSRPIAMVCTRDGRSRPDLHESFLAQIEPRHAIALVPEHLAGRLAANVADNGAAAILVSRAPGDHRSVQLKGRITEIDAARPRPELFDAIISPLVPVYRAFMPEERAHAMLLVVAGAPVIRVRLDVMHVYDQSPGPSAGRAIQGGAR